MGIVVHSAQIVRYWVSFSGNVCQYEVELENAVDVFAQRWWQRFCLEEAC